MKPEATDIMAMDGTCEVSNITSEVATMFDAIVQSIDWGSGFLCSEEIEAIAKIGKLMGWKLPEDWEKQLENAKVTEAVPQQPKR